MLVGVVCDVLVGLNMTKPFLLLLLALIHRTNANEDADGLLCVRAVHLVLLLAEELVGP